MHTHQTFLCTRCGARQAPAERCRRCRRTTLQSLADRQERAAALGRWHDAYVSTQTVKLCRRAPSARRGLAGFLTGSVLTVVGTMSFAFADATAFALLAPIGAGIAGAAAAIGVGWYALSPRTLLASYDRHKIDREVEQMARQALAPIELLPPDPPAAGSTTVRGRVRETSAQPAPFGERRGVAWRVTGMGPSGKLDEGFAVPFELVTDDGELVQVELSGGAVISIPVGEGLPLDLSPEQAELLSSRGAGYPAQPGRVELSIGAIGPGEAVEVTGVVESRPAPAGYREVRTMKVVMGTPWIGVGS